MTKTGMAGTIYINKTAGQTFQPSVMNGMPVFHTSAEPVITQVVAYARENRYRVVYTSGEPDGVVVKRKGHVLIIGSEIAEAGAYYAFLTGRKPVYAAHAGEIDSFRAVECILLLASRIDEALLNKMISQRGRIPALLPAPDLTALQDMLILKAIRFHYPPVHQASSVAHFSFAGHTDRPSNMLLQDTRSSPAQLRRTFRASHALLGITSHSDGIDLSLGPLTLCPVATQPDQHPVPGSAPVCVQQQYCHRSQRSFAKLALQKETGLYSPREIRSRIVFLNTCEGLKLVNGRTDAQYFYSYHLLANIHVCQVLCTWKIIYGSAGYVNLFASWLSRNKDCAGSLAMLNRLPALKKEKIRYLCLGDHGIDASISHMKPVSMQPKDERIALSPDMEFEPQFYQFFLLDQVKRMRKDSPAARVAFLNRSTRFVNELLYSAESVFANSEARADFITAAQYRLAGIFCETGLFFYKSWTRFSIGRKVEQGECCTQCGFTVDRHLYSFGQLLQPRVLHLCPVCGIQKDAPLALEQVCFERGKDRIRISNLQRRVTHITVLRHNRRYPYKNARVRFEQKEGKGGVLDLVLDQGMQYDPGMVVLICGLGQPLFYYFR